MAEVATKIETETEFPEKTIEVKPTGVQLNSEGYQWRELMVRMPEGSTSDDLRNPKIWKHVQENPNSKLLKHDKLYILGADESWSTEARVCFANHEKAKLSFRSVSRFRDADENLFNDGTYEVRWSHHGGYVIHRIKDGQVVGNQTHATEQMAINAIRQLYPKKVVG